MLVSTFAFSVSSFAYTLNHLSPAQMISEAVNSTNPRVQEVMAANIQAAEISYQNNVEMAEKQSVFLTCTIGEAAVILVGIAAGIRASLVFGLVRTTNGNIRGEYSSFSFGGAVEDVINLGQKFKY